MAKEKNQIEPAGATELDEKQSNVTTSALANQDQQGAQALGSLDDDEMAAQLAYETLRKKKAAKKRKRMIIIAVIFALVIAGAGIFVLMGNKGDATEQLKEAAFSAAATVERGTFTAEVSGNGKTEPASQSVVSPEVSGIVENLNAQVGQQVKAGDVLFTLKNEELDDALRKAEQKVEKMQQARDSANYKVDEAYAAREDAWNKANDSGDWSTYEEHTQNVAVAGAEDTLNSAEADLREAEIDLEKAQKDANKRTVVAPVDGSIVAVNIKNGQSLGGAAGGTGESSGGSSSGGSSSNSIPIQIADTSQMKVAVQINEVDIENVATEQPAVVTFQALPDVVLESKVQNIATVATSSGSGSGDQAGGGIVTYAIELLIPNQDGKIKPGMTANVTITTKQVENVLIVPSAAVFDADMDNAHVLKVTDAEKQTYESVPVEVQDTNATQAAIAGDIKEGDKVLIMNLEQPNALDDTSTE